MGSKVGLRKESWRVGGQVGGQAGRREGGRWRTALIRLC